jgi:hypothetical protein
MLVENKFIYISLPRCASTSFMASCVKYGLNINHFNEEADIENQLKKREKNISDIKFENFQNYISHIHEPIDKLKSKFGKNIDIISVKRNKYEKFISLWKVVLREMHEKEHTKTFNICSNLKIDDILFYNSEDLKNENDVSNVINEFIMRNKLTHITPHCETLLRLFIQPHSYYHKHDPNIIWFDFDKLNELEHWVSKKLNIDFKLVKVNSSQNYQSNLILNEEFKHKYDLIYKKYDEIKSIKTLI